MDRSRRTGPDPFLEWKLGAFFLGALLLIVGMATKRDSVVMGAAVVLGIGAAISLIDRVRRRRAEEQQAWEPEEDDGDSR